MRLIRSFLPLLAVAFAAAACASRPAVWDQAATTPFGTHAAVPGASTSSIDAVVYGPLPHAAPRVRAVALRKPRGLFTTAAALPLRSLPGPSEQRGLFMTAAAPAFAPAIRPQAGPFMTAAVPAPVAVQQRTLVMAAAASPPHASAPVAEPQRSLVMAAAASSPAAVNAAAPQEARIDSVAAAPAADNKPYTLDSGDRLRVVVFGQDGLSNSYLVDASGYIAMPLIGTVPARGATTEELSSRISDKLRDGYVKEPHVAVEVEAYRPFFILGEVTQPGQYPYVADMTVETAVAIAGGFGPRAFRHTVTVTRTSRGERVRMTVPTSFPLRPGDTVNVQERWF